MKNSNKVCIVVVLALSCLWPDPSVALAQSIRCSYSFWRKNTPEGKYRHYSDMKVDLNKTKAVFYAETNYLRDSLRLIAFDSQGNTVDDAAYGELTRIRPGNTDIVVCDYEKMLFSLGYQVASVLMYGRQELGLPTWTLSDETKEIQGYACKKATADYLGRTWTIWYTEDVPVSVGPWLLWGAPGLIIDAFDSDKLFYFRLTGTEALTDPHRISFLENYYAEAHFKGQHFSYPLKRIESLHLKAMTDKDFLYQLLGISSVYRISSDGNRSELSQSDYIPLIPTNYWK